MGKISKSMGAVNYRPENRSDNAFRFVTRFKRAAFYMGLKSKVGLVAAKASALRINLNVHGCSIVAPPLHAPSRAPLLLPRGFPLLLSHKLTISLSQRSLVGDWQTSSYRPRLVVSGSTCPPSPPPPLASSFVIGTAVINTHIGPHSFG